MQELRAGDESNVGQEVKAVLRIGRIVLRSVQRGEKQCALHGASQVLILFVVDRAVVNIDAGDEAVAEAADDPLVRRAGKPAVVLNGVVEVLIDRMVHVAIDAEDAELDQRLRRDAQRGLVGQT
jgi:hypothetical protein